LPCSSAQPNFDRLRTLEAIGTDKFVFHRPWLYDTGPFEVFRGVMNWHASGRPLVDPQCNWQRPGVGREFNATCGAAYVFKESFGVVKCATMPF
jgi:hypothetical protein